MFGLGTTELLVIGGIIVLLFGAKRLPEIGKGLGSAIREFRNVGKEISPNDKKEESKQKKKQSSNNVEGKLAARLIEEIPGVKKGLEAKNKAEQIKEIIS
ncbi:MAG: Sec-independent protein translocase subunit TatA/TatB [Thermodesulfobacteriota bacterium]